LIALMVLIAAGVFSRVDCTDGLRSEDARASLA
jgi:hypothetical protein